MKDQRERKGMGEEGGEREREGRESTNEDNDANIITRENRKMRLRLCDNRKKVEEKLGIEERLELVKENMIEREKEQYLVKDKGEENEFKKLVN